MLGYHIRGPGSEYEIARPQLYTLHDRFDPAEFEPRPEGRGETIPLYRAGQFFNISFTAFLTRGDDLLADG